jgi:hypothetical protein
MAPIWWIVIAVIVMVFGVPLLTELRDVIIRDLRHGLDGVGPGVKGVALLAMVLITVVALAKIFRGSGK